MKTQETNKDFPRKQTRLSRSFHLSAVSVALFAGLTAGSIAHAQNQDHAWGIYGQIGAGLYSNANPHQSTIGVIGPLPWTSQFAGTKVTTYWDGYISQWRAASVAGGDSSYTQLAFVPSARFRFDDGASRWFMDAGIGLSYLDGIYATPRHSFSTRFNFTEFISLGRSFGDDNRHEVSLRVQHYSNAGIKKPNPGENFVQLRYAVKF
jgi:lipid A 3-O-deacylase